MCLQGVIFTGEVDVAPRVTRRRSIPALPPLVRQAGLAARRDLGGTDILPAIDERLGYLGNGLPQ
jgi:hypothetical protein